jgi:hypothetical protein
MPKDPLKGDRLEIRPAPAPSRPGRRPERLSAPGPRRRRARCRRQTDSAPPPSQDA